MDYSINGFLFSQRPTGVMRYAREILVELDKLVSKGRVELVVPEYVDNFPNLENISVVKYGGRRGNLWEQIDFPKYLRKNKTISVNFNNTFPYFLGGIIFIHDIAYKLHPEFGTSLHGKISNIYHKAIFRKASRGKFKIVTVSEFSKNQLIDFYHIDPQRITVIGSAWQQMNTIFEDDTILGKLSLEKNNFYFSLGSLSKMKNTKWVIEVAKRNPESIFVLSGAKSNATKEDFESLNNVINTGFISDGEIKSLMKNCKAFIYPSIYDGFGLPPLEALSQGAKVICSPCASLTEVYGNTVRYIDPYEYDIDLEGLLNQEVADSRFALSKYGWDISAKKLFSILFGEEFA